MLTSATGSLVLRVEHTATYTGTTGETLAAQLDRTFRTLWTPGTGVLQFDTPWAAAATLTASSLTFTLSALPGPDGGLLDLVRVREFLLFNLADPATSGNSITVAPGSTHPWAAGFVAGSPVARAGGWVGFSAPDAAGVVVAAGSADQFTVSCAGTAGFLLALKGASA